MPSEALEARLSGLPECVSVEPGRIEVRFRSAKDAVGRLFALAQALTNDYEQFEALVEGETPERRGRGEEMSDDVVRVEPPDALRPPSPRRWPPSPGTRSKYFLILFSLPVRFSPSIRHWVSDDGTRGSLP